MPRREYTLARITPLSAFRVTAAISLVGLVSWMLAVSLLYAGLAQAGIWEAFNSLIGGVGGGFQINFGVVIVLAAIGGIIMSVLMMLIAPLLALAYNAIADLFGGLRVRLDDDAVTGR